MAGNVFWQGVYLNFMDILQFICCHCLFSKTSVSDLLVSLSALVNPDSIRCSIVSIFQQFVNNVCDLFPELSSICPDWITECDQLISGGLREEICN